MTLHAQEWLQEASSKEQSEMLQKTGFNFYDIQNAYRHFHKQETKDAYNNIFRREEELEEGWQFSRWEWFTEQRVYPSGTFPIAATFWNEFLHRKNINTLMKKVYSGYGIPSWHPLVSPKLPYGGSSTGMGRINCMTFVPGNSSSYLVGAATGGIWKTTDDGFSWSCLNTDLLPALSIADIAINPNNINELYVVTGDMFAGFPGIGKSLQGQFSAGVLKSTDGGLNWNTTGMSFSQNQMIVPQRMLLHPINDDSILVASFNGVWRSTNAGKNWTKVKDGSFFSMEMNPKNSNIIYLTDANGLWRSDNFGTSWIWKGGGYSKSGSFRVSLAISNADTNIIYLWGQGGAFKKYNATTKVFTTMTSPDALVHPYGLYDRALGVVPWNAGVLFVGGSEAARSLNGGSSWSLTAQWNNEKATDYIHQDVKRFYFRPNDNYSVFALTDGGIFKSKDLGATWSNISKGIQIAQIYRITNHPKSADTIIIGQQDCASNLFVKSDSSIKQIFGGDGMQSLYDPYDPATVFVCGAYGNLQKSKDGAKNFVLASPGQCMWLAPYAMNPKNSQTMYIGAKIGVRKSTIGGEFLSWVNVSSAPVLDSVIALAVTDADSNVVYAAKYNKIVRSDDGGGNWVDISAGLPVSSAAIDYITVSSTDRNRVYVCFSGYSGGNKVFVSTNGGASWTNYSGSLANVPVNCVVHVQGSPNNEVYTGTDFGVYYRNDNLSDWISFNNGLPNVIVNHLQIEYATMKLRAGTYGRGLWECDLVKNEFSSIPYLSHSKTELDSMYVLLKEGKTTLALGKARTRQGSSTNLGQTLGVYPNPAQEQVLLESAFTLNDFSVKLYSEEGRDLSNYMEVSLLGEKNCILKFKNISTGLYYIVLNDSAGAKATASVWVISK